MICKLIRCAVAVFLVSAISNAQAAFLEGKSMVADREYRETAGQPLRIMTSNPFIVGPGVELEDFGASDNPPPLPGLVDIDISDTRIVMTLVIDQPSAFLDRFRFLEGVDEIEPITNVTINPATNWGGFISARLFWNENIIVLTFTGLSGLTGQQVVLDVIPEPASAVIALTALAALAFGRRRRASLAAASERRDSA